MYSTITAGLIMVHPPNKPTHRHPPLRYHVHPALHQNGTKETKPPQTDREFGDGDVIVTEHLPPPQEGEEGASVVVGTRLGY